MGKAKWIPEISHHAPGVPIILVGTKSDLRNDTDTQNELRSKNMEMVSEGAITQMKGEIGAVTYIECSALTQEGLKSVFDEEGWGREDDELHCLGSRPAKQLLVGREMCEERQRGCR